MDTCECGDLVGGCADQASQCAHLAAQCADLAGGCASLAGLCSASNVITQHRGVCVDAIALFEIREADTENKLVHSGLFCDAGMGVHDQQGLIEALLLNINGKMKENSDTLETMANDSSRLWVTANTESPSLHSYTLQMLHRTKGYLWGETVQLVPLLTFSWRPLLKVVGTQIHCDAACQHAVLLALCLQAVDAALQRTSVKSQ